MSVQIETERKYLIRMPDESFLSGMPGCEIWDIEQIYLQDGPAGETRRIRSVITSGEKKYFRTEKRRVSALSSVENEEEIASEAYRELKEQANPALNAIIKRRYRIPYAGLKLEVDIYSFWNDRATLEIELPGEDTNVDIPEWISIIRDVSSELQYKNRCLADRIPMEDISES